MATTMVMMAQSVREVREVRSIRRARARAGDHKVWACPKQYAAPDPAAGRSGNSPGRTPLWPRTGFLGASRTCSTAPQPHLAAPR
eukprot:2364517-Prymnesium_polylepis.1